MRDHEHQHPVTDELDQILPLIESIYDTVLDPSLWTGTLEKLSNYMGLGCAGVSLIDTRSNSIRVAAHWGAEPAFIQAMMQSVAINPATTAHWYLDIDEPFTVEGLIGSQSYVNSRFYKTVNLPHNCRDGLISILSKSGDRYGNISLPRWNEHGPITAHDLARLKRLSPHIRRAVTLTDALDTHALKDSLLSQTFDHLSTAIMLVDGQGRIVHANQSAETLLGQPSELKRHDDRLVLSDPAAARRLANILSRTIPESGSHDRHTAHLEPNYLTLSRGTPDEMTAWVMPLNRDLGRQAIGFGPPLAAIIIGTPLVNRHHRWSSLSAATALRRPSAECLPCCYKGRRLARLPQSSGYRLTLCAATCSNCTRALTVATCLICSTTCADIKRRSAPIDRNRFGRRRELHGLLTRAIAGAGHVLTRPL